jgi:hypothetical protein
MDQIEDVIKSWKGYTALVINEKQQRKGQIWQEDSWNRIIRDDEHWLKVMRYIANNPVQGASSEGEFTMVREANGRRTGFPTRSPKEAPPPSPYPEDEPW